MFKAATHLREGEENNEKERDQGHQIFLLAALYKLSRLPIRAGQTERAVQLVPVALAEIRKGLKGIYVSPTYC